MARFRRGDDSNSATAERKDALGRAPGMPALLGIGCGNSCKVFFPVAFVTVFRTVSFWKGMRVWGAPGPLPLKGLTGAGFCKNGLQNSERLGVRGQIHDNKRLTVFFATFGYTPPP